MISMLKSRAYSAAGAFLERKTSPTPGNIIVVGTATCNSHCPALGYPGTPRFVTLETRSNPTYPKYPQNNAHKAATMRLLTDYTPPAILKHPTRAATLYPENAATEHAELDASFP